MNYKIILLFCILILGANNPSCSFAQTIVAMYNSSNSPLPYNEIHCIAIDNDGVTWIGTENGLAALDGAEWTVYNTDNSPLPENSIRSIGVDAANRKWFGTFSSGLAMYDGNAWIMFNTGNSGLPDNFVKSIAFDNGQKMWLGLSGGLAVYDGLNWQFYTAIGSDVLLNNVNDVVIDTENHIWICPVNGGLVTFTKNEQLYAYKISNSGVPDNTLLAIAADAQGKKWMTTAADGLGSFDGINWQTFNVGNSDIAANGTTDVCANLYNNDIWIGTFSAGISIYHPQTNLFTNLNTANTTLPDNYITAIAIENNGSIWVGTKNNGLVQFYQDFTTTPIIPAFDTKIYPNPCNQQLHIHSVLQGNPSTTLSVYSATSGQLVLDMPFNRTYVNTANLPDGIYYVRLLSEGNLMHVQKFIVVH